MEVEIHGAFSVQICNRDPRASHLSWLALDRTLELMQGKGAGSFCGFASQCLVPGILKMQRASKI
eukprot:422905-Pelagomonas_calceolata.AAC.3